MAKHRAKSPLFRLPTRYTARHAYVEPARSMPEHRYVGLLEILEPVGLEAPDVRRDELDRFVEWYVTHDHHELLDYLSLRGSELELAISGAFQYA